MDLYPWLKVAHILLAVVAVRCECHPWDLAGSRLAAATALRVGAARSEPLGDRVADPASIGLGIVGVLMVLIGPWEFEAAWIAVSIGLYVAMGVVAFGFYSPTLPRQIRAYEADGPDSPQFAALGCGGRLLGALLALIVVAIIVLMVLKPGG